MKETNYLISSQHLVFRINNQTYFRVKTELKVIGHMSDPNSTSSDILSDGPVKDLLRPARIECISFLHLLKILVNFKEFTRRNLLQVVTNLQQTCSQLVDTLAQCC